MPSEQSLLQTSRARAVFGAFNDSSRARLFLDLGKEVDDVSAAAEMEIRSQHEDWRLRSAAIRHGRFTEATKENEPEIHSFSK